MRRATGAAATTTGGLAWQAFAFLGGMAAYAVHLMAGSALVPLACELGTVLPISVLSWSMIAVATAALVVGVRIRRGARAEAEAVGVDVDATGPESAAGGATATRRTAFLGLAGALLSGLAITAILVVEAHVWVFDPCLPG